MKIGLFGGSFNPVHKGHLEIARLASKQLELDQIIFIPAAKNPFKKKQSIADSQDRINMLNLALADEPNFTVSEFETKRGGVSYTFETIRYFRQKFPNDQLFFLMGSDLLPKLNKWEYIEEIAANCQLVAFRRSKQINRINAKRFNVILLKNPLFEESSTAIRSGHLEYCDDKVASYIGANFLYAKEIVHNTLKRWPDRAKHCVQTAEFAVKLAQATNYSVKKAYFTGLFHDICKYVEGEVAVEFLARFMPLSQAKSIKKHEYHQLVGYYWLKHVYKLSDEDILHAIKIHTTMAIDMSILDKILFVADKICEGRRWPGIQKLRKLALEDFEAGFVAVVRANYEFNLAKGVVFDEPTQRIYDHWLKQN
ncbi:nicotinate-nucleotide adenylyltransferase [Mycoplasmopsis columbinasalis]|uniref:Probable nicotinate-nucleotide adenylyltransferase n=1 Tax=Mycoplasmopsis columbinasalis TaxID=114880 RepID=A0A449B9K7_9BACT|nr:nicotinate-nucleotide adenylyltransferase [Mycoplasmopsis columbinasalis]VEU77862.1 nicotinate-nucleotide adenylyltransferase [Mycoplasmopsis columbinasalis]